MSTQVLYELDIKTSAGAGVLKPIANLVEKTLQLQVAGSGDYDVEITVDDVNWFPHTTGIVSGMTILSTEDPTNPLPKAISQIRIVTAVFNAGDTATLFGHDRA